MTFDPTTVHYLHGRYPVTVHGSDITGRVLVEFQGPAPLDYHRREWLSRHCLEPTPIKPEQGGA